MVADVATIVSFLSLVIIKLTTSSNAFEIFALPSTNHESSHGFFIV